MLCLLQSFTLNGKKHKIPLMHVQKSTNHKRRWQVMCKYLTCRSWFSISLKTECDLKPSRLPSFELPDEPLVDLREEKKKKVKWKSSSARERGDRFQSSQVEIGFSDGLFMLKKYLPCKSRGKTEKATLCRSQLYIITWTLHCRIYQRLCALLKNIHK